MKKSITMKEIILMVIFSIVFGIIYKILGPVVDFGSSIIPFFGDFLVPIWNIAGIVIGYVIRKTGAAFVGELLASIIEVLTAGQFSLLGTLIEGSIQGAGAEIVFFLFGYKRWTVSILMMASVLSVIGGIVTEYWIYGFGARTVFIQIGAWISRLIGALIVCGWLGKWLSDKLAATSVLNNYAIVRMNQSPKWGDQNEYNDGL